MDKKAFIVTGLQNGDEAKGATVDYLTRKHNSRLTVRFNGASQCAHNVITPDGKHHTFSQFGSGTFAGAQTYLSEYMLCEPNSLLKEALHLKELGIADPFKDLFINANTTIITPFHILANRIKEIYRDSARHGSCGHGVNECATDKLKGFVLQARDLSDKAKIIYQLQTIAANKYKEIQPFLNENTLELSRKFVDPEFINLTIEKYSKCIPYLNIVERDFVGNLISNTDTIVFESGQGMLLDDVYGFAPYNTYSNITITNALRILKGHKFQIESLGLMRSYTSRHGPGPFATEDKQLSISEAHNTFNQWQREFRVGYLDLITLRYAIDHVGKIDKLVINHCDQLLENNKVAIGYSNIDKKYYNNGELQYISGDYQQFDLTKAIFNATPIYDAVTKMNFVEYVSDYLGLPVKIAGFGPTANNRQDNDL